MIAKKRLTKHLSSSKGGLGEGKNRTYQKEGKQSQGEKKTEKQISTGKGWRKPLTEKIQKRFAEPTGKNQKEKKS